MPNEIEQVVLLDNNTYDLRDNRINSTDIENWNAKADIYDIVSGVGWCGTSNTFSIILGNHYIGSSSGSQYFMIYVNSSKTVSTSGVQMRKTTNDTSTQITIAKAKVTVDGTTTPSTISSGLYYCVLSGWSDSATLTLTSAPTTKYTAGTGIDITNGVISLSLADANNISY